MFELLTLLAGIQLEHLELYFMVDFKQELMRAAINFELAIIKVDFELLVSLIDFNFKKDCCQVADY